MLTCYQITLSMVISQLIVTTFTFSVIVNNYKYCQWHYCTHISKSHWNYKNTAIGAGINILNYYLLNLFHSLLDCPLLVQLLEILNMQEIT